MELMVFVLTVWRLPRGCGRVGLIWLLALKLQHSEFQIGRVFRGFRHLTCSRFFRMSHTIAKRACRQRIPPTLHTSASQFGMALPACHTYKPCFRSEERRAGKKGRTRRASSHVA